jgi:hypothetical protein
MPYFWNLQRFTLPPKRVRVQDMKKVVVVIMALIVLWAMVRGRGK